MDGWYRPTSGLAMDFFANYSSLFKDEDHVIYEIANEPTDISWDNLLWYHNIIIDTIRANTENAIIIVGTPENSQVLGDAFVTRVDKPYNVLYAFHFYASVDAGLLEDFTWYAARMPLFVSQWGIGSDTLGTGDEYDVDTAEDYLNVCAAWVSENADDQFVPESQTAVSWVAWSFTDLDESPASLLLPNSCRLS